MAEAKMTQEQERLMSRFVLQNEGEGFSLAEDALDFWRNGLRG